MPNSTRDQYTLWEDSHCLGVALLSLVFSWLDGRAWLGPLLEHHLGAGPRPSRHRHQPAGPVEAWVDPFVTPPGLDWPLPDLVVPARDPLLQSPINLAISAGGQPKNESL